MKRIVWMLFCGWLALSTATAQDKKNNKETVTFSLQGMHCENCVKKIEKNIAFEKGVTDLICNLPDRTATVTWRADKTTQQKLIQAFKKIGMQATPVTKAAEEK